MFPRFLWALALTSLATLSVATAQRGREAAVVDVQLLAFNDFHGNLEPPSGTNGRIGPTDAGGIEYLATHLARLKATNPNTIVVSAGDNIGASPLVSGMFHDEPTVEALGAAGLQVSTVGNHEFDEGWWELYRMQKGGCHPVDGCQDGTPFEGARFVFLSANVLLDPRRVDPPWLARSGWTSPDNRPAPLFPPYVVKEIGGVKLGFIGLTLEAAPQIIAPAGVKGLTFAPEASTANTIARTLRSQGVRAIVVLIHQGGQQNGGDYDGCSALTGPIVSIVGQMSDDIGVVVSGHSHQSYNCMVGTKLVTSAESYGRLITDIDLRIDRRTDRIVSKSAHNVLVTRDVDKNAGETALVDRYRPAAAKIGNRVVGSVTTSIIREPNEVGESALGDVVADGMLDATRDPAHGGAVVALMNLGGLRADLAGTAAPGAGDLGPVTYADVFNVMPFGNVLIVKTLSGDALVRLLEQQFTAQTDRYRLLQVSDGFTYSFDPARPNGQRVNRASVTISGRTIAPTDRYRVAMPDFLWSGGDGLTVATEGIDPVAADPDIDVFVAYLGKRSPLAPGPQNRVQRTR